MDRSVWCSIPALLKHFETDTQRGHLARKVGDGEDAARCGESLGRLRFSQDDGDRLIGFALGFKLARRAPEFFCFHGGAVCWLCLRGKQDAMPSQPRPGRIGDVEIKPVAGLGCAGFAVAPAFNEWRLKRHKGGCG